MSDEPTTGMDCYAYYNAGTYDTPSWIKIPTLKDVQLPSQFRKADGTTRDSSVGTVKPTVRDITVTLTMRRNRANAVFEVLRAAHYAKTTLDVVFVDDPIATAGAEGPRFTGYVTGFDEAEPMLEFSEVSISIEPAAGAANDPEWHTVST